MGLSQSRDAIIQHEQDILNTMDPPVKFETYDVTVKAPGDALEDTDGVADEFPIRTMCIRARDNCVQGETPPNDDELGDPVIIVHGFMCALAMFFKLIPLLVQEFQTEAHLNNRKRRDIYLFDLLGHGASGRPEFDLDPEDVEGTEHYWVECIDAWVRKQFPDPKQRFHLCGHSFGGFVCGIYALEYPNRIASLGCLSPLWGFDRTPEEQQKFEESTSESWMWKTTRWGWNQRIAPQSISYYAGSLEEVGFFVARASGDSRRFQPEPQNTLEKL